MNCPIHLMSVEYFMIILKVLSSLFIYFPLGLWNIYLKRSLANILSFRRLKLLEFQYKAFFFSSEKPSHLFEK